MQLVDHPVKDTDDGSVDDSARRGAGGPQSGRLAGPVDVALARAADTVPLTMPGGLVAGLKFDGYRAVIVKGTRTARIWSRHGVDLTAGFPEVAEAAVAHLPPGCVLDGELVILGAGGLRTDFGLLGRRLHVSPRRIAIERQAHPASWVGFDLLAVAGTDVRPQPLRTRLRLLQELADEFAPPLQLCPTTTDHATATRWMTEWAPTGVEGVVVKGLASPYVPGSRAHWVKVKNRSTTELIVGGLTGTWDRPTGLVGGRFDAAGRLRIVARSTRLSKAAAAAVRDATSPSRADHPWPDVISAATFSSSQTRLLRIEPVVVAEVVTDIACDRWVWRHPVRLVRLRPELSVDDVPRATGHGAA